MMADTRDGSLKETCRVSTTSTLKSTCDWMQRSLEDFQFNLETALTMSQFTEESPAERNAATLMIEIPKGTEGNAAKVAAMSATE